MRRIFCGCVLAALALVHPARAILIDVIQGGAFLGTIEAYSGSESPRENYDYFSHSGDPNEGPNLRYRRGEIFFYERNNNLTFNMIFNKEREPGDPRIEGAVSWDILAADLTGARNPRVVFSDDPQELWEENIPGPNAGGLFLGRWQWVNNTDGGIIGGFGGPLWAIVVNPQDYEGLNNLKAFSATGERIDLNLRTGPAGNMIFLPHVPDAGATMALLALGLGGMAVCRRRQS